MHIAIDARIINSSTGSYVVRLLEHLQKIDTKNTYTILVRQKDIRYWLPTKSNFRLKVADFDNYSFSEQIGFKHFLDKLAPDLVHFCMPQQPVLYKGKKITTVHDLTLLKTYNSDKNWLIFHLKQLVGKWLFKHIAKTNEHIIAISNHTRQEYQAYTGIKNHKITTVYEAGIDGKRGSLKPYDAPYESFIMYVGQQPDYKNVRFLMNAHQKLLEKYPSLGLILVGRIGEDTARNKRWAEKQGYKNIHFTDFIPDEQRNWLYTKTQAYVFPSLMEGFGLPPLEAMAYGAPIVSSNASCLPEILGSAPLYFDPHNITDAVQVIDKVLSDDVIREKAIRLGDKQVKKYSWDKTAKQTLALYNKILSIQD